MHQRARECLNDFVLPRGVGSDTVLRCIKVGVVLLRCTASGVLLKCLASWSYIETLIMQCTSMLNSAVLKFLVDGIIVN